MVLIGSYVLASNFLPATQLLACSVLNVLQSYLLAAVLAVLWLLYRQRVPEREHPLIATDNITPAERKPKEDAPELHVGLRQHDWSATLVRRRSLRGASGRHATRESHAFAKCENIIRSFADAI